MLVLGTQVHIVTFIFIILEFAMFCIQLGVYLHYPGDKSRLWYLILLLLLLFYNVTGGLFPDPKIGIPLPLQEMIAYGSGFLMASYFPFYFYRAFDLRSLRWHALYGVPLFLMLPYLVFFVVAYAINGNLNIDIKYGVIAPFFYSLVLLWVMLAAIRKHYRQNRNRSYYLEEMAVYLAVSPWAAMTVFSWFQVTQLTEVLCTNTGFVVITGIFIVKSVRKARAKGNEPVEPLVVMVSPELFQANCLHYGFTRTEVLIAYRLDKGMSSQEIAESMFSAEGTINKHIQNMFRKAGVKNRAMLLFKLRYRPD